MYPCFMLNIRHQLTQPFLPGMRVNLRRRNAFVPEQRLDVDQLHILFQQPRGVGVPELVRRDFLLNSGLVDQLL